ncbi:glycosyltransferase [Cylindrospermopsis raciborskii]
MLPIGEALLIKGHRVTFVGIADAQAKVEAIGIDFFPVAMESLPQGSIDKIFETLGEREGLSALLYTIGIFRQVSYMVLQDGAIACKDLKLDGMVIDQTSTEAVAIAKILNIPYVTLCSALPFNQEAAIPPVFTTWQYGNSWFFKWFFKLRNQLTNYVGSLIGKIIHEPAKQFLKNNQLPIPTTFDSSLAIICHQPKSLEYPRQTLPDNFHFTGPFHSTTSRKFVDFPWEKLSDKPLIYASMGTLQNRRKNIFQTIAAACENLDIQLVISLGGSANPEDLPPLPGHPLVVRYAPQIELLQRASLTITHGGMNTTLESLTHGVPLVAIPITNDQPGIAARIKWSGCGEFLELQQLTVQKLREKVKRVLQVPSYRDRAQQFQQEINHSGGINQAIAIIEQAILTQQPVVDWTPVIFDNFND